MMQWRHLPMLLLLMAPLGCNAPLAPAPPEPAQSDRRTEARVKAALTEALGLAAAAIAVEASDGVVTLSGFVASSAERQQARAAARAVGEVRRVVDRVRLKR
jgi:hyperosmotically inducible protein